jgi:hypothetical protein
VISKDELNLLHSYLDGTLEEADFCRLQILLRERADARRMLRSLATVETKLNQLAATNTTTLHLLANPPSSPRNASETIPWFSRRPAAAAVAGLLMGLFCATMVFAYMTPAVNRPVTVLETSFESTAPTAASGVPDEFGKWGGDYSELVGAQNGVTPRSGTRMWRFLQADNALESGVRANQSRANYVGEAIYVLDLKHLPPAEANATRQMEISAWFAQGATASDSCYHWNIKAAAFEGSVTEAPKLWGRWDDVGVSVVRHEAKAQSGAHWQPLSVTMPIPAHANFLVFECAVVQRTPNVSKGVAAFPAHYLDDVRVRLLPPDRPVKP